MYFNEANSKQNLDLNTGLPIKLTVEETFRIPATTVLHKS